MSKIGSRVGHCCTQKSGRDSTKLIAGRYPSEALGSCDGLLYPLWVACNVAFKEHKIHKVLTRGWKSEARMIC